MKNFKDTNDKHKQYVISIKIGMVSVIMAAEYFIVDIYKGDKSSKLIDN